MVPHRTTPENLVLVNRLDSTWGAHDRLVVGGVERMAVRLFWISPTSGVKPK